MLIGRASLRVITRLRFKPTQQFSYCQNAVVNNNLLQKQTQSLCIINRQYSSWITRESRKEYTLHLDDFKEALKEDKVYVVDVREPFEVEEGRVPATKYVNIPIGQIFRSLTMEPDDFEKKFNQPMPKKDEDIVIMCKAGIRSTWGFQVAQHFGFSKAKHYIGGWNEWENQDK